MHAYITSILVFIIVIFHLRKSTLNAFNSQNLKKDRRFLHFFMHTCTVRKNSIYRKAEFDIKFFHLTCETFFRDNVHN